MIVSGLFLAQNKRSQGLSETCADPLHRLSWQPIMLLRAVTARKAPVGLSTINAYDFTVKFDRNAQERYACYQ